jgi:hypothetical protein
MKRWIKRIVLGVPVTSDSGNRDNQFRRRIMDVATPPPPSG